MALVLAAALGLLCAVDFAYAWWCPTRVSAGLTVAAAVVALVAFFLAQSFARDLVTRIGGWLLAEANRNRSLVALSIGCAFEAWTLVSHWWAPSPRLAVHNVHLSRSSAGRPESPDLFRSVTPKNPQAVFHWSEGMAGGRRPDEIRIDLTYQDDQVRDIQWTWNALPANALRTDEASPTAVLQPDAGTVRCLVNVAVKAAGGSLFWPDVASTLLTIVLEDNDAEETVSGNVADGYVGGMP